MLATKGALPESVSKISDLMFKADLMFSPLQRIFCINKNKQTNKKLSHQYCSANCFIRSWSGFQKAEWYSGKSAYDYIYYIFSPFNVNCCTCKCRNLKNRNSLQPTQDSQSNNTNVTPPSVWEVVD